MTPAFAAGYAWHHDVHLPPPTASTQPAQAVTGLDTFLTIGGPQRIVVDIPELGFDIHLDVTSTYDVDWGDPHPDPSQPSGAATTRHHTTQGGPYPDGDLRHQYVDSGHRTIAVTQRWTARWSAAGEHGVIAGTLYTTGDLGIDVGEIQAVVTG